MAVLIRFHSQQDALKEQGLGSARTGPWGLQEECRYSPTSQWSSHKDSPAGNTPVKTSVTAAGTRPVPAPWPCYNRETGAVPGAAHRAGQGLGRDGVSVLLSFWVPHQHQNPSACIQHVLPSL